MQARKFVGGLAVMCLAFSITPAWAGDEGAAQHFASGKTLLARGDLEGAYAAFKAAAKAEPENDEYYHTCALLRRIMNLREQLPQEKDPETWQKMAQGLYSFYQQYKVYGEALSLAEAMHAKEESASTAVMLARAQLALDRNAAAVELLAGLDKAKRTPQTDALHGVGLARLGRVDEARAWASRVGRVEESDARFCFDAARLYALVGEADSAVGMLKRAFESTPADQLAALKAEAKECPDLSRLVGSEAFAQVLAVESKLKAGCGTSEGCGKCPSKAKAACDKDRTAKEEQSGQAPACEHDRK